MKKATVLLGQPRLDRRPQRLDCLIAKALRYSLEELGFEAVIRGSIEGKRKKTDLLFVLWGTEGIKLANYPHEVAVHVTSEQLPFYADAPSVVQERWEKIKEDFHKYHYVFEHSSTQAKWLKEEGYGNVVHFPWGYTPVADQTDVPNVRRKYNIRFMGTVTPRRDTILKLLKDYKLSTKYVHENRGIAIRQAAINLSLHNAKSGRGSFPSGRVITLLLGNGAFVISEPPEPEEQIPLIDGEHLVYANGAEEIKEKVDYYLQHKEERIKIAQQGYDFVTQHFTMTQNLKKALEEAKIL